MLNATFYKLITAWEVNYKYNDTFHEWWDKNYSTRIGFYGEDKPVFGGDYPELLKIMRGYQKTHCVLFNEYSDFDEYSDRVERFDKPVGSFVPEGFLEWQREYGTKFKWLFYNRKKGGKGKA